MPIDQVCYCSSGTILASQPLKFSFRWSAGATWCESQWSLVEVKLLQLLLESPIPSRNKILCNSRVLTNTVLLNSIHVIRSLTVLITLYLPSPQTWLYGYSAVDTSIFNNHIRRSGSNYSHSGDDMWPPCAIVRICKTVWCDHALWDQVSCKRWPEPTRGHNVPS